jgi:hypothetical protein
MGGPRCSGDFQEETVFARSGDRGGVWRPADEIRMSPERRCYWDLYPPGYLSTTHTAHRGYRGDRMNNRSSWPSRTGLYPFRSA